MPAQFSSHTWRISSLHGLSLALAPDVKLLQHLVAPVSLWRRAVRSGADTPLVVFLHGRGADEHDLMSLAQRLPRRFSYVSLRGPVAVEGGGYTWFENRGVGRPIPKSVRASVRALRGWLDDPQMCNQRASVYLLGFSAGMMMAGALVLHDPRRWAGAILLSGALLLDNASGAEAGRLAGVPIFYACGSHDDVMPQHLVAQTQSYLRTRSGAILTEREYDHAHSISRRETDDIAGWLSERA